MLPSGTTVRIRVPEADLLIRRGMLPADLLEVAGRFVTTGINLDEASTDDRLRFDLMVRHMVASMVRGVQDAEGSWEELPVGLPADQLDELELPPDDLRALELIARRQATPQEVSAAARVAMARDAAVERVAPALAAQESEEAASTVTGWAPFRGEPTGPVDRADGGAVRAVPGDDLPGHPGPGAGDDG